MYLKGGGVYGSPPLLDLVAKLNRSVGNLGTQCLQLASEVAVL